MWMGSITHLRQEGRGIGLHAKIQLIDFKMVSRYVRCKSQTRVAADARDYSIAAQMLQAIGGKSGIINQ